MDGAREHSTEHSVTVQRILSDWTSPFLWRNRIGASAGLPFHRCAGFASHSPGTLENLRLYPCLSERNKLDNGWVCVKWKDGLRGYISGARAGPGLDQVRECRFVAMFCFRLYVPYPIFRRPFPEAVLKFPAVFARLQKRRSALVKPTGINKYRRIFPSALRAPRAS